VLTTEASRRQELSRDRPLAPLSKCRLSGTGVPECGIPPVSKGKPEEDRFLRCDHRIAMRSSASGLELVMFRSVGFAVIAVASLVTFTGCRAATPQASAPPVPASPAVAPDPQLMTSHPPISAPAPAVEPVAAPPGGLSIVEIWAQRKSLSGKAVTVRGQVVKVNNQILERNWIHLQDGSGSAAERTHDLTITTDAVVKLGDVVTFTGVLATGKDIGAGYAYDAIVENGKVVK
jgi:hypothetical protein